MLSSIMYYRKVIEMSETVTMPKKRLQVTVRKDLVDWMDKEVELGKYASRSHAIDRALIKLKENES